MIPDSYRVLIQSLANKTSERAVNWKSTADRDTLVIYFKDFSLSIASGWEDQGYNEDPLAAILVNIYNDAGEIIDSFTVREGHEDYQRMEQLHAEARRKALRIDEAIASLMQQLESDSPIGDDPPEPADDLPF
jgi:hypothetical protein